MKISAHSRGGSSPLSACFYPFATATNEDPPSSLPSPSTPSYLSGPTTTCHYHSNIGVFFLSWSQAFLRRSLHLHFYSCHSENCYLHSPDCYRHSVPYTFRLEIKPFTFWRKHGSKKISRKPDIRVVWDLTQARFASGPDPESGFYVAVFVSGEVGLLVGNSLGGTLKQRPKRQILVSRRENLFGNRVYCTKIKIKGKLREISIDVKINDDANLRFSVDNKRVLKIKQLQWKFRGNAKIVIDGVTIQISWDVYNWLFGNRDKNKPDKASAVFLFQFENQEVEGHMLMMNKRARDDVVLRQENPRTPSFWASSYGHWSSRMSSVMEWSTCREEDESSFGHKSWFSLIVYAWRK